MRGPGVMGDASSLKTVTSASSPGPASEVGVMVTGAAPPGWQRKWEIHTGRGVPIASPLASPGGRLTGEFVRGQFTPPAEERENPMDSIVVEGADSKVKGRAQE